jgi:hypothetical protein
MCGQKKSSGDGRLESLPRAKPKGPAKRSKAPFPVSTVFADDARTSLNSKVRPTGP